MTQQFTLYHACLAPDQTTILGYSAECWGYIHVPYSCARAQDGLNGRLSIHMIYESIMSDWTLIQPILFDNTLTKAAETAAMAPTEEPAEAGQDWASQDTWSLKRLNMIMDAPRESTKADLGSSPRSSDCWCTSTVMVRPTMTMSCGPECASRPTRSTFRATMFARKWTRRWPSGASMSMSWPIDHAAKAIMCTV